MRAPLLMLLLVGAATVQTAGRVVSLSLEQLARASDLIVIVKVESLTRPRYADNVWAKAKILEVWKGSETNRIGFLASNHFGCDVSDAEEGEGALLFLTKDDEPRAKSNKITNFGRGRMPLRVVGGKRYAEFSPWDTLPAGIPTIAGPPPQWFVNAHVAGTPLQDWKLVELETLREVVKKAIRR